MSEKDKCEILPVAPLVTADKAAAQWRIFEDLKSKLLTTEDYQKIADKIYIKRSGFRKIAVFFGISDRIQKEERIDRPDGSFAWRIEVEAYAPNGRSAVGVGACDSRERKFAHLEHDVLSVAHTRAKSRAISDLVAGGIVSAEEMTVEESKPVNVTQPPIEPTAGNTEVFSFYQVQAEIPAQINTQLEYEETDDAITIHYKQRLELPDWKLVTDAAKKFGGDWVKADGVWRIPKPKQEA